MNAVLPFGPRRIATSAVTLHVGAGPHGEESKTGKAEQRFLTIQAAVNALMWEWDLRGRPAKIKVADGIYRDRVEVRGVPLGSTSRPAIIIEGNVDSPSSCILDVESGNAFENWGGHVEISGFKFLTKRGACIYGHDSGRTLIGPVEFGQSGGEHILVMDGHVVRHKSDYEISGGATIHVHVTDGASYGNGRTVTLTGTPHFRDEFHGLNFARSLWAGTRFIGSATGMRHVVHFNAVCAIGGADPGAFFPGERQGSVTDFSTMA